MSTTAQLNVALSGRYTIERELGAGGMATVYLAHDVRHDRKVALKVLRPELAAILGAERFLAEIKTTANLQHPHILSLFDSGEADGTVFYVMPYVEGESLRDRLKREQQLPIEDAVRIAREVLDALQYAHEHGIVHRDIKPENILLHGGHALVADFGIALAASKVDGGTRMTETGMSLGTPHYMAPEQAMGERVITAKADVYALGAVLYEMLTGEPPFTGGTAQAIFARVLTDEPRSLTLQRKTIPQNMADAVRTALQKLPADRFASAREFASALGRSDFTMPATRAAAAANMKGSRRLQGVTRAIPWVLFVIAAGVATAGWLSRPTTSATHQRIRLHQGVVDVGSLKYNLAISRDSRSMVYVDTIGGPRQLWLKDHNELEAKPLTGTALAGAPTFSADGEWIAFVAEGKVKKVPRLGGSPTTISDDANPATPAVAWLDDGTIAYSGRNYSLRVVSQNGGESRVALRPDSVQRGVVSISPLPQGRVLLTMCSAGCRDVDLRAFDPRSGSLQLLGEDIVNGWFTPHGDVVFVRRDGGVFKAPFDVSSMVFSAPPVPVLDGVRSGPGSADFVLSPTGTAIYIRGIGRTTNDLHEAVWIDRSGRVTPAESGWTFTARGGPSIAPDGRRIAVAIASGTVSDIWIKEPAGPQTRLTFAGVNERPQWSRDGRKVIYLSTRDGNEDVRMRRADGTGTEELALDHPRQVFEFARTPDTTQWIVRLGGIPSRDIFLWRRGTQNEVTALLADTRVSESQPALSPDGRWLAYVSDESGRAEVYVRPYPNLDSGRWQVSRNGGREPQWSHNGRELFFRDDQRLNAVEIRRGLTFETGQHRALFPTARYMNGGVSFRSYDVAPDDRRFLFLRGVGAATAESEPVDLVRIDNWFEQLRAARK